MGFWDMGIFGILFQNMGVLWAFLMREILIKGLFSPSLSSALYIHFPIFLTLKDPVRMDDP